MMDEKVGALIGAAAAVTIASRGLRPVAKFAMRGVVAAGGTLAGARNGLAGLYAEVKAEQRAESPAASATESNVPE